MLPYWYRHSRDDEHGGFLLPDDVRRGPVRRIARRVVRGPLPAPSEHKQVVTQARLVWVFAHAHVHGFDDDGTYLAAARRGYDFLDAHFLDTDHGGYAWMTDRSGNVLNPVKALYAQAFVIYGFVELARATGDAEPLDRALALLRLVEAQLHDDEYGGWREHADADWSALPDADPRIAVPFPGRKSGNAVLHWMEALTELAVDTDDHDARRALAESLDLCRLHLYPADPAQTLEPCLRDWRVDPGHREPVSYGHNVEFAWLMLRAQRALGVAPDWARFHAYLGHTLRDGFDHGRGGAIDRGAPDNVTSPRFKSWWVQCELIAALTEALTAAPDPFPRDEYATALAHTLEFTERHMTDPRDGVMIATAHPSGRRSGGKKSGDWKAGYHDVRAAVKFAEAFGGAPR